MGSQVKISKGNCMVYLSMKIGLQTLMNAAECSISFESTLSMHLIFGILAMNGLNNSFFS